MMLQDLRQKRQPRLKSIDALRGIAAVLVMIIHICLAYVDEPMLQAKGKLFLKFLSIFDIGRIGITIFFIISGFAICKSFSNHKNAIQLFAIKRFFRLYPLFWFSILMAITLPRIPKIDYSFSQIIANATMIPAFFNEKFIIGLYWSLETELLFYFLAAILFYFGYIRKPIAMLGITILLYTVLLAFRLVPAITPLLPHWAATPYHLSLMFLGVLLRYHYDKELLQTRISTYTISLRTITLLQLLLVLLIPIMTFILYFAYQQTELLQDGIAYFIGIILFLSGLHTLKESPAWLVYLGTISYSIYLLHPLVFRLVYWLFVTHNILLERHIIFYLLICSGLTILISHGTYQMIEKRWNQKGHALARKVTIK